MEIGHVGIEDGIIVTVHPQERAPSPGNLTKLSWERSDDIRREG